MGNFFSNLNTKIQTFMIGRNGSDQLALAALIVSIVLVVIDSFLGSAIISIIAWALLLYSIFRCLSTNISARQIENDKFEDFLGKFRGKGSKGGSRSRGYSRTGSRAGSRDTGTTSRAASRAASRTRSGATSRGSSNSYTSRTARNTSSVNRTSRGGRANKATERNTLYFSCEQCGQKLSVPKGKGSLKVTCPKCNHQQKVNS